MGDLPGSDKTIFIMGAKKIQDGLKCLSSLGVREASFDKKHLFIKSDACETQTLLILRIKKMNRVLTRRQTVQRCIMCSAEHR